MPSLAPAEQRVARLAVSDPGRAARWTISEYAEKAKTSGTTIIRFCRAIGLDGYPALRIALAATAGHGAAGTWRSVSGDIGAEDVVVGISYTGTTLDTIDPVRLAKANGALAVALTNHPRSVLASVADLVLTTAARETTFRSGAMTSRIAQFTVIDCVFALVA